MRRVIEWAELHADHLAESRSIGAWTTVVSVHGVEDSDLRMALAAASAWRPADGGTRWLPSPTTVASDGALVGQVASSSDLAGILRAPAATIGGIEVADAPPAARAALTARRPIDLGVFAGTSEPVTIDVEDLAGHAFVTGVTGSGKTNSTARLLTQLVNRHDVPTVVIDPIKDEYRRYAGVVRGAQVLNGADLRMNVLQPWPGFDASTHLGLVAGAFRGCFSMPTPVPYVLRLLFDRVLAHARGTMSPTLHDLISETEPLIASLGYAGEIESNIRASLGTRLRLLTAPERAEQYAAATSELIFDALARSTVVQLGDIGDDEERSFLMTMLAIYATEAARQRGPSATVTHVTILEEAHRLIPEPRAVNGGEDGGDPAAVSARLLTQLLAEIRAYGQAIVIVDQSPAAVAREVIRNTNLKLVHRVVDPEDRAAVGGTLGLDEQQSTAIARLGVGEALLGLRRSSQPLTVHLAEVRVPNGPVVLEQLSPTGPGRPCCGHRAVHHRAEAFGATAEDIIGRGITADLAGEQYPVGAELARLAARAPGVRESCLTLIGVRRFVRRLVDLEIVADADVADVVVGSFGELARTGLATGLSSRVGHGLQRLDRPFAGCSSCPSPCAARPWIHGGFAGRLAALRHALGRYEEDVALWEQRVAAELGPTSMTAVAIHCALLHAAVDRGRGDRVELVRAGGQQ